MLKMSIYFYRSYLSLRIEIKKHPHKTFSINSIFYIILNNFFPGVTKKSSRFIAIDLLDYFYSKSMIRVTSRLSIRIVKRLRNSRFTSCKQNLSAFSRDIFLFYLFESEQTTLNPITKLAKLEATKPCRPTRHTPPLHLLLNLVKKPRIY